MPAVTIALVLTASIDPDHRGFGGPLSFLQQWVVLSREFTGFGLQNIDSK